MQNRQFCKLKFAAKRRKKITLFFTPFTEKQKKRVLHFFFTPISPRSGGGKFTLFFLHHFGEILNTLFFKNNRKIHRKQLLHSIFTPFSPRRGEHFYTFFVTLFRREAANFFLHHLFLHFFCFKNEISLYFSTFFLWIFFLTLRKKCLKKHWLTMSR